MDLDRFLGIFWRGYRPSYVFSQEITIYHTEMNSEWFAVVQKARKKYECLIYSDRFLLLYLVRFERL